MPGQALKDKKFFFDKNIFDPKEEPVEPPPPTFSEAELESARKQAFSDGRREGVKETENSIARQAARTLEKISAEAAILFAAESLREKNYEAESVRLCLAIFEKAFPLYKDKFGIDELRRAIENVVRQYEGQKQISIHVAPQMITGIQEHLDKLKSAGLDLRFTVHPDESLKNDAARLVWSDGGAVRNPEKMAADIVNALKDLLAGSPPTGHDGKQHNGDTA